MKHNEVELFVDGGSRGNPGRSGAGVFIRDPDGTILFRHGYYLGNTTNNAAEYMALLYGLKLAHKEGARKIKIYSDSLLVVSQVKGTYKISNSRLKPIYQEVIKQLNLFIDGFEITHIPREKNKIADSLANHAIDLEKDVEK